MDTRRFHDVAISGDKVTWLRMELSKTPTPLDQLGLSNGDFSFRGLRL
jgi:hypothetical protein